MLKNQPVLLVGGGSIALHKARILYRAGVKITLVSRQIASELISLAESHQSEVIIGDYHPELLANKMLVVAATNDSKLNQQISQDANDIGILVNVVDNANLCSFIFPSIIERSPVTIAISSGGKAPILSRLLRTSLEAFIPPFYGKLAEFIARFRKPVKQHFPTNIQRLNFWDSIIQSDITEKVYAGREQEAAAAIEEQLNSTETNHQTGCVYLVGSGPGDPDLLTLKAFRLIRQADSIFYDALVSESVLALCRSDADMFYVGKQRNNHSLPQEKINQLLIEHARVGKCVVRLKGGDPFIFGRGGEEIQSLKEKNIPFQVVPGITAASACSAFAGIPLTHRDFAHSVVFATGQLKNRTCDLDFNELINPKQTLVFYMGLHSMPELCQQLITHGMPAKTPAALVSQATSLNQKTLIATLKSLPELQAKTQLPAPALLIIGDVVKLHQNLSWFKENL